MFRYLGSMALFLWEISIVQQIARNLRIERDECFLEIRKNGKSKCLSLQIKFWLK